MNYAALQFYLAVLQCLITAALFIYVRLSNREKVTNSRFTALEKKVADTVSKPEVEEINVKLGNIPFHCPGHNRNTGRLDGHNDRLAQHAQLIAKIEAELGALPKVKDIKEVHQRIDGVGNQVGGLQADIAKIAGAMPGIVHITNMINDFLIEQGGKK